jgi:hypothetical protein
MMTEVRSYSRLIKMKKQLSTSLSKGYVAEFVENDEVHARDIFGEPPLPAGAGFTLQPISLGNRKAG